MAEKISGKLSINSENIFPIIKKWLYQDHDIFFRELISNGCDAIIKLKKLALIGEYTAPEDEKYRIDVTVNPSAKTIKFEDNGIGMTAEEVRKYINDIAFSGAADFLEKYKDKANEDQIIGHFGLGFYSAFMASDRVTIDTLSYQENAEAAFWESDDGMSFSMSAGSRTTHGTTVTLYINEDELKFCNEYQAREVIDKYCSFMPVEIYLKDEEKVKEAEKKAAEEAAKKAEEAAKKAEEEAEKAAEGADKKAEEAKETSGEAAEETSGEPSGEAPEETTEAEEPVKQPWETPVNDTHPLWNENPAQVTEDQYKEFYRKVFRDYREPLFWIHLNMDYPFNLKGILYFPKINLQYDNIEGTIKLYNNQVFIADNIKEVIPEYLMLLKGVIDCPDLPLNVSRSALQNDGFVKKISDYITKKVSDRLAGMFKTERENYEKYWDDISPFIKFGCIRDEKFGDKMKNALIFKDLDGKYLTVDEYLGKDVKSDSGNAGAQSESSGAEDAAAGESAAKAGGGSAAEAGGTADAETGGGSASDAGAEPEAVEYAAAEENEPESGGGDKTAGAEEVDEEGSIAGEEGTEDAEKEKPTETMFYVTDEKEQGQYILMFKKAGKNAVILNYTIDTPFISYMERKREGLKFVRIDADVTDEFKDAELSEDESKDAEKIVNLFKKALNDDKLDVKVEKLLDADKASMMTMSEEGRRMQEMMKMYAGMGMDMGDMGPEPQTLVLNLNNDLVRKLAEDGDEPSESSKLIAEQLYDMALLSRGSMDSGRMQNFIKRSQELLKRL